MALAQIKKALYAGVGAGLSAAVGAFVEARPDGLTNGEWGVILGGFVAAAFTVGLATYNARNLPPREAAPATWPAREGGPTT